MISLHYPIFVAMPGSPKSKIRCFEGKLVDAGGGGVFVYIPYDCEKEYGKKGQVKVKATFDGQPAQPYRGSIANMGSGNLLIVLKSIRAKIGKQVGDMVTVCVEEDTEERVIEIPSAMKKVLDKNPKVKASYDKLSFSHRKEYVSWIASAKREETVQKRMAKMIEKLNTK
jgi:hypothetical protein